MPTAQCPASRFQSAAPWAQHPASRVHFNSPTSRVQCPGFRVQRPEPNVQSPTSRAQSPASRFQRPDFSVQSPAPRVQRPESSIQLLRPKSSNSSMPWFSELFCKIHLSNVFFTFDMSFFKSNHNIFHFKRPTYFLLSKIIIVVIFTIFITSVLLNWLIG